MLGAWDGGDLMHDACMRCTKLVAADLKDAPAGWVWMRAFSDASGIMPGPWHAADGLIATAAWLKALNSCKLEAFTDLLTSPCQNLVPAPHPILTAVVASFELVRVVSACGRKSFKSLPQCW